MVCWMAEARWGWGGMDLQYWASRSSVSGHNSAENISYFEKYFFSAAVNLFGSYHYQPPTQKNGIFKSIAFSSAYFNTVFILFGHTSWVFYYFAHTFLGKNEILHANNGLATHILRMYNFTAATALSNISYFCNIKSAQQ